MKKLNLNKLAEDVTRAEGGKKSINIGQVKEVIRLTFKKLKKYPASQVLAKIEQQK